MSGFYVLFVLGGLNQTLNMLCFLGKDLNQTQKCGKNSYQTFFYVSQAFLEDLGQWVCFSGNRKWCRQTGSRQSTPVSTILTRYGNSVSTPEATRSGKTQQNSSPRGKPVRSFSIDPTLSIRTSIADAVFEDAISETPIFGAH